MAKSRFSVPDDITPQIVLATMATKRELDFHGNALADGTKAHDRYRLTFISTMRKTQQLAHWMATHLERRENLNHQSRYGIDTLKMVAQHDLGFYVSGAMVIAAARALNVPVDVGNDVEAKFGFTTQLIRNLAKQYSRNQKGNYGYESAAKAK